MEGRHHFNVLSEQVGAGQRPWGVRGAPPVSPPRPGQGPAFERMEGGIVNNDGLVHRGGGRAHFPHPHSCRADSHVEAAAKLQVGTAVPPGPTKGQV